MASDAETLLENERDLPKGPMSYLLATGMLGNLVQGKNEAAFRLWQQYHSGIVGTGEQSVLFRLLVALSTKK
jgi:hypothetical protein